jgi:hypothetical protein
MPAMIAIKELSLTEVSEFKNPAFTHLRNLLNNDVGNKCEACGYL